MANRSALLVSPDPGLVQQARGALNPRGVATTQAANVDEALVYSAGNQPGLVIAEVDLPGTNGYDLCRALKSRGNPPTVLLLYSAGEGSAERNVGECGADGSLQRPFFNAQLIEQVQALMGPSWLDGDGSTTADPLAIVDPSTGVFAPVEDSVAPGDAVLQSESMEFVVENGEYSEEPMDLLSQAIEVFDESHPVSIPVGDVTAHSVPAIEDDDPFGDESFGGESSRVQALGPRTGEFGAVPDSGDDRSGAMAEAARVRRAVDARLEELLGPSGGLASFIEQVVTRAVAEAMAQAVPLAAEAAARKVREQDSSS